MSSVAQPNGVNFSKMSKSELLDSLAELEDFEHVERSASLPTVPGALSIPALSELQPPQWDTVVLKVRFKLLYHELIVLSN